MNINGQQCQNEVTEKAECRPECGYEMKNIPTKKSKLKLIIIIIVVFLIILAGIFLFIKNYTTVLDDDLSEEEQTAFDCVMEIRDKYYPDDNVEYVAGSALVVDESIYGMFAVSINNSTKEYIIVHSGDTNECFDSTETAIESGSITTDTYDMNVELINKYLRIAQK